VSIKAGEVHSTNLYAYVNGDPINFYDPFGRSQCDIDVAVEVCRKQPDLKYPPNEKVTINPSLAPYDAQHNWWPWDPVGNIEVDDAYAKDNLSEWQQQELLETVLHEGAHVVEPFWKEALHMFNQKAHQGEFEADARRRMDAGAWAEFEEARKRCP